MKIGALFSGGKDSAMTLAWALEQGHEVVVLVSIKANRADSYMFHIPNIDRVKLQAEAMEIPLIFEKSSGEKELELDDLKRALEKAKDEYEIDTVMAGALASTYQKERVEKIADELRLKAFTPYWQHEEEAYVRLVLEKKIHTVFTGVAADGLDDTWLGRVLDETALKDLKKVKEKSGVHLGGEGGEYETFVTDAPFFNKKIILEETKKEWDGTRGMLQIIQAHLEEKHE